MHVGVDRGNADAEGEAYARARHVHRRCLDTAANAFGNNLCVGGCRAWQHDQELLATITAERVLAAQLAGDRSRHRAQAAIASAMAVVVVDALEIVEVEEQQRKRLACFARVAECRARAGLDRAAIQGAGKHVAFGEALCDVTLMPDRQCMVGKAECQHDARECKCGR